ncbi:MAG: hypothetical protein QNJ75_01385 [Acidimicrobiia bacterium]|nr:hypothetical protein [Acidimicrobiia bacterium]
MNTRLLIIPLLALAVAGCSSADDGESVASLETVPAAEQADNSSPLIDSEQAMLDFAQCLRDQGVEVGDPTMSADGSMQMPPIEFVGSPDEDPEAAMAEMDAIFAECESHLEGIALTAADPGAGVAFEDALLEYAACMRDQGIDMPDPDLSGGGGVIDLGLSGPGDQEEWEAAHKECQPILAGAGLDI